MATRAEILGGHHVARCWFGWFDLPSGEAWLHSGVGEVEYNGETWRGVTNPLGGVLVSVTGVEEPRFGQAAAASIVLGGVTSTFWASVKADARDIEGRDATLWVAVFDPESEEIILWEEMLAGKMTSPGLVRQGIGSRIMTLTIENFWASQNFPSGGRWNYADQLRRYPGDKGGQFIGQSIQEQWK